MKTTQHQCITSFLVGFGSILNVSPVLADGKPCTLENHRNAIKENWQQVGNYFYRAMGQVVNEPRNS